MPSMPHAGSPERGRQLAWVFAAVACLGATSACGDASFGPDTCDRPSSEEPKLYTGGSVENGVYMSADWYGELLYFPGGAYYRIEHQLGVVPRWWIPYLSFSRTGLEAGDSLAVGAGDQAQVLGVDAQSIIVLNGTCSDFYLLMVVGE